MILLYANKTQLRVKCGEQLTSGSVNVNRVRFEFSEDWTGLTRTAVFRGGGEAASVLLDGSGECVLPWEALAKPNVLLEAGVYGARNGDVVLPTVWAALGTVLEGAAPGEESKPPTPELWRQELDQKGDNLDYDGLNLKLRSGERVLSEVQIVGGGEGVIYRFGHGLKQNGLDVSVDAVSDFSGDNTLPMTAAGVQASVGNIEALLATI